QRHPLRSFPTRRSSDLIVKALADSHPRLRENAVKLAMAKAGESEAVAQALIERADDEDLWVRYQTAFALGEVVYGKSVPEELVKDRKSTRLDSSHVKIS